jgi:sialate O-acetylesterase
VKKNAFLPEVEGVHGSSALWEESEGHEECWKAVEAFLREHFPVPATRRGRGPEVIALAALLALASDVRLPALFGDHMVLQRESTVRIWGWAEPGERVEIRAGWSGASPVAAEADAQGRWQVQLATPAAGGPYELAIAGRGKPIELREVHVGEVWIGSGQSNMEWTLGPGVGPGVEGCTRPSPRPRTPSCASSAWRTPPRGRRPRTCARSGRRPTPDAARAFSATAYFFARKLREELGVPIGVITSDWGGTVAEAWTSPAGLAAFPEFAAALASQAGHAADPAPEDPNAPALLWNGMIAPLRPYVVRGVIWYQGEANRERAEQYRTLFPALIRDWRVNFRNEALPFYFVQLAPYGYPGDTGQAARLRDAQRETLALPNTGMAVTMDIGNPADIHPSQKREVGERLALWALAHNYGRHRARLLGPALPLDERREGRRAHRVRARGRAHVARRTGALPHDRRRRSRVPSGRGARRGRDAHRLESRGARTRGRPLWMGRRRPDQPVERRGAARALVPHRRLAGVTLPLGSARSSVYLWARRHRMARTDDVGKIGWIDLTVGDAPRVRDFYEAVVGWKPEGVDMGGYQDFNMTQPATGSPVAGSLPRARRERRLPGTVDDLRHRGRPRGERAQGERARRRARATDHRPGWAGTLRDRARPRGSGVRAVREAGT